MWNRSRQIQDRNQNWRRHVWNGLQGCGLELQLESGHQAGQNQKSGRPDAERGSAGDHELTNVPEVKCRCAEIHRDDQGGVCWWLKSQLSLSSVLQTRWPLRIVYHKRQLAGIDEWDSARHGVSDDLGAQDYSYWWQHGPQRCKTKQYTHSWRG